LNWKLEDRGLSTLQKTVHLSMVSLRYLSVLIPRKLVMLKFEVKLLKYLEKDLNSLRNRTLDLGFSFDQSNAPTTELLVVISPYDKFLYLSRTNFYFSIDIDLSIHILSTKIEFDFLFSS
jgi:hypothetical protein